jgi:hypothetical protein
MSVNPSRTALIPTISKGKGEPAAEIVLSACFERDDLSAPIQIVSSAVRSIYTARRLLGAKACSTFFRWQWDDNRLFIFLGLSGVSGVESISNDLQLWEDIHDKNPFSRFLPSIWHREGLYATIVQDTKRSSLVVCGTQDIVAETMLVLRKL